MANPRLRAAAVALVIALLAAVPATASAGKPSNGRCRVPADASIVQRSASALLYTRPAGPDSIDDRLVGCLKSHGGRHLVAYLANGGDEGQTRLLGHRLTGRFAAAATQGGGGIGSGRRGSAIGISSVDLRTGRRARGIQIQAADDFQSDVLRDFAVNTSGDLGWIVDRYRPGVAQGNNTQIGQGYFGEVHVLDGRGDVLLEEAAEGALSAVRMYGRSISWAAPGRRRAAALTR